jgi:hypothetical protein
MKNIPHYFRKSFCLPVLPVGLLVLGVFFPTVAETAKAGKNMIDSGDNDFSVFASQTVQEKRGRTPAQQKIDSQLLFAIYRKRGEAKAKGVPTGTLRVRYDEKGRAIVSIRARVTKEILAKIKKLGGEIISSSERYNDILAHLPLEKLEKLAALPDVRAIMPGEEATTNSAPR